MLGSIKIFDIRIENTVKPVLRGYCWDKDKVVLYDR